MSVKYSLKLRESESSGASLKFQVMYWERGRQKLVVANVKLLSTIVWC